MADALEVDPQELIEKAAKQLEEQKMVQKPVWAGYVRTGHFANRPPVKDDWWYMRAAAVLRSVYKLGPVGTSKLRTKYGGRKNRGYKPEHFYRGSGSIIRKILQQLEKSGLLAQVEKGVHKGRKLTPKGKLFLEKISVQIAKEGPKERKKQVKIFDVKIEEVAAAPIEKEGESAAKKKK